jgi:hypothetical protein
MPSNSTGIEICLLIGSRKKVTRLVEEEKKRGMEERRGENKSTQKSINIPLQFFNPSEI